MSVLFNTVSSEPCVLVSWGCYYKVPPTGWLKTRDIYSHTVLEVRSPSSRCWQGHAPSTSPGGDPSLPLPASGGTKCPLAYGYNTAVFSSMITLLPPLLHVSQNSLWLSLLKILMMAFRAYPDSLE